MNDHMYNDEAKNSVALPSQRQISSFSLLWLCQAVIQKNLLLFWN